MSRNIGVPLNLKRLRLYTRRAYYFRLRRHERPKGGYCRYYPSRSPLTKLVPSPTPSSLRCDLFLICNHHAATTDRYPLYHPTGTLHGLCAYLPSPPPPPHRPVSSLTHTGVHTNCRGFGYREPMRQLSGSVRNICFGINFPIVCWYARFDKRIQRRGQSSE